MCHDVPMFSESAADRCPGVLRPHEALDGALLRLRIPGGQLNTPALTLLMTVATEFADGNIHLTSRANLQLRGVRVDAKGDVPDALVDDVVAAGLLPSPSHERVRNIVASPLSGVMGGLGDVRPVARDLDRLLCARASLGELPGRFLFSLDDGRGDVAALRSDLGLRLTDPATAQLVVGQGLAGPSVPINDAAAALVALASRFMATRTAQWHVADLPLRGNELLDQPGATLLAPATHPMPYGLLPQRDGRRSISVLAPLGTLVPTQIRALVTASEHGTGDLVVTPWRGIVVPNVDRAGAQQVADQLTATGLVADGDSPWSRITACAGAPGCNRAQGSTSELAHIIAADPQQTKGLPIHVVACDHQCGTPAGPHTLVFARSHS